MHVLSIVKRVPDSRAAISVRTDGSGIDDAGLKYVCDPFDEFGVEQAVQWKEKRDDVDQVTVIAAGPDSALEPLRTAIAMGATRAIHVAAPDLDLTDELAEAHLLAAAIQSLDEQPDVILCGKQQIDNDAGVRGPALAAILGMPHIGAATALTWNADGTLHARRRIEGAEEVITTGTPVLVTCEKGLVEPRHPALPKLMKAKKHPIETIDAGSLDTGASQPSATFVKLTPPASRPACQFLEGEPAAMAADLVRRLRDEAKVL